MSGKVLGNVIVFHPAVKLLIPSLQLLFSEEKELSKKKNATRESELKNSYFYVRYRTERKKSNESN